MWGASIASVGVLSPFVSLLFCRSTAPVSTSIWFRGKTFLRLSFSPSHFSGCITSICTSRDKLTYSLCSNPETDEGFFFLPTLFHSLHILVMLKATLLKFYLVFACSASISQFRMFWRSYVEIWHPPFLGFGILAD